VGSDESGVKGQNPPLALLPMLLTMQPRVRVAFWAASAHCRLLLSFPPTSTPKSFSSGLLWSHSPPSLCLCLGLHTYVCVHAGSMCVHTHTLGRQHSVPRCHGGTPGHAPLRRGAAALSSAAPARQLMSRQRNHPPRLAHRPRASPRPPSRTPLPADLPEPSHPQEGCRHSCSITPQNRLDPPWRGGRGQALQHHLHGGESSKIKQRGNNSASSTLPAPNLILH